MQTELIIEPRLEPEEIVSRALAAEGPVLRTFCLLSGGNDSTVCAHRCRDLYDELAFIDTGTALPGVREFVEWFAQVVVEKPLTVLDAGDAYRRLVLGDERWWERFRALRAAEPNLTVTLQCIRERGQRRLGDGLGNSPLGFPGPAGGHRAAYARLKERQVERLARETKAAHGSSRLDRIAFLAGSRRRESRRRMRTTTEPFRRTKAQLWIAPLVEWDNAEMAEYRRTHELPQSDVAALIHRSGECNCGAYAGPSERQDMLALYPDWFGRVIAPLEREAAARGIPRCVWGERVDTGRIGARGAVEEAVGELCSDCQLRLEAA